MNEMTVSPRSAHIGAVIPTSIEEMWRVSKMVVLAGIAPAALVKEKDENAATSAVCVAIMSGAELGLPPMVALRSFTVINGKPALYGDGLINVIRRSGKAEYITTGYDAERGVGWCEAKRRDTGEEKRVEFSLKDALRAGLYVDSPTIRRKSRDGGFYEAQNDAPWYRYPQRMAPWRAAGYCLRDLFADVLGGMPSEDEVIEITAKPVPVLEDVPEPAERLAPPPPPPPAPEPAVAAAPPPPAPEPTGTDPEAIFGQAETWGSNLGDVDDIEAYRDEFGQYLEVMSEEDRKHLEGIMQRHIRRVAPNPLMAG